MTWLFAIVGILVVAGVLLAMLGLLGELPASEPDLRPDRIDGEAEFDVVVRGYRMDEVDEELSRLQAQIDRLTAEQAGPPAAEAEPPA